MTLSPEFHILLCWSLLCWNLYCFVFVLSLSFLLQFTSVSYSPARTVTTVNRQPSTVNRTVPPDSLSLTGIPHLYPRAGFLVPSLFKLLSYNLSGIRDLLRKTGENGDFHRGKWPGLCSTTVCSNCPLERMREAYVFEFNYCCPLFTVQSSVVIQHHLLSVV
jgi:hypothetical protein